MRNSYFACMIVAALWICISALAALQIFYCLFFLRHIWRMPGNSGGIQHRALTPPFASKPVSIIICACNEAENLRKHLPGILKQKYKWQNGTCAYEVIVVNDASTDESFPVLSAFKETAPHLTIVNIEPSSLRALPGKKFPLSVGLAAAKHAWILCTDADCSPASDAWLHFMTAPLAEGKEIVAGYGGYVQTKGFLNGFIRYETAQTFLLYYAAAKAGMPYMAVGRNMAATKETFLTAQSHALWAALPSGDDDLLVQLCATGGNMAVITHPASFTWSAAKEHLSAYISQKRRHVSTGKFYNLKSKLFLGGYAFLAAFFVPVIILSVLFCHLPGFVFIALLSLWALKHVLLQQGSAHIRERTTVFGWVTFSLCWVLYNAVLAPYILWKTKQRWK